MQKRMCIFWLYTISFFDQEILALSQKDTHVYTHIYVP